MLIYNNTIRTVVIAAFAPVLLLVVTPLILWDWKKGRLRDYEKY